MTHRPNRRRGAAPEAKVLRISAKARGGTYASSFARPPPLDRWRDLDQGGRGCPVSHASDFEGQSWPRPEAPIGETGVRLPLSYHRNDAFASLHTASYDAVAAVLPTDAIEPVRWLDQRALVS